jgi:hypothetical protein
MHGHPFSGPMQLWWGKSEGLQRPRNIFHTLAADDKPDPADMFRAGGYISTSAHVDRDRVHGLMAKLMACVRDIPRAGDNRRIPSGYTYLLQFIAHDMVDSIPSLSLEDHDVIPGARNARSVPLLLDTLYGSSPDECPHAFEVTEQQQKRGLIPRIYLRVGARTESSSPRDRYCPARDIVRLSLPGKTIPRSPKPLFSEPMLADVRNDSHAIISQLTVLFQTLHNHIVGLLDKTTRGSDVFATLPQRELAYRTFQCARTVSALIYRNIIEKDVLKKILDECIFRRYAIDKILPVDSGESIPVEFTFGAFRFGHAMVRDMYSINDASRSQSTVGALRRTSLLAHLGRLPIGPDWLIDWAHFFPIDPAITPNFSPLIQPRYPTVLNTDSLLFPARVPAIDTEGLMHRDLVSAAFAGVLSVPALIEAARRKGFETVEEFSAWQERIRIWLKATPVAQQIGEEDIERLASDPPLPFFVLFEADHSGGEALGPLGSVIVAETIFGTLRANPIEADGDTLKARIETCGRVLFDVPEEQQPQATQLIQAAIASALSEIDEIETMPQLLDYMRRAGIFAPT